ncbi:ZIP metal ion transporter [Penicillium waksmanii]|uniref:ZIP metal ion transporter n=1 Tax=Penicillium waksmanii TaxID=69791 RepID=UPI0025466195|nr:ZIP metal ion transporter [Penicillium waksmanii]KAJ5974491.1 ZIP metal ion transporter [Penicillium waksmanii]
MTLAIRSVQNTEESHYSYDPSLVVAIVAAVLYGIAFLLTLIQWVRYKSWVWLTMVVAAAMEAIGYIARCISTQNVTEKSVYVLQFALIILAPVLMAACCYVLFGRIIFLVVPRESRTFKLCWVPPRFITPLFVGFDIVALFLQLVGAVMLSSVSVGDTGAAQKLDRGKSIAQAGVIIQLVAFGMFSVAAVRFNFTSKRFAKSISERYESSGEKSYIIDGLVKKKHWPALLRVVNFTTLLILVRSIYRLVEFTEGTTGYLNTHEWTMYVFDALVIYPCVALYVYWHPGKYLPYLGFQATMEGLFTLLVLSIVMAITSFVVGSLPLAFTLSPSQLRLISSIGMGVLVGTSLIVIIPEGIETLYSAKTISKQSLNARATTVEWQARNLPVASIPALNDDDVSSSTTTPVSFLSLNNADYETPLVSRDQASADSEVLRIRKEESSSDKSSQEEEEHEHESSPHAWVGIALVSGFILMYLIDKLPEFASPTKPERQPYHISLDNLGSGLRRNSSPIRDGGLLDAGQSSRRGHSFATTMGLVIHAAADGIALGASSSDTGLSFIIFLAIMVHKAPASFGLTSILLKQGLSSRTARAHLLVFSLAAPVGALATFLFAQMMGSSNGDEAAAHWRTGMLLLFSGGTFLYVAMHTMQENGPGSSSRTLPVNGYGDSREQSGEDKSMRDLIASVLGMILPLFLQIGHAH